VCVCVCVCVCVERSIFIFTQNHRQEIFFLPSFGECECV